VAIVLSVLLYCYSLIMGTADTVLPWALKILMIALVTVAVFIYRKPFSHLFSAVGYGTLGSTERAEYSLREASHTFRRSTLDAATAAVPGMASYRAARWARRNPGQAAGVAAGVAVGATAGGTGRVAPPLDLPPRHGAAGAGGPNGSGGPASASASGWSRGAGRSAGTGSTGAGPRPRAASAPPAPSSPRPPAPSSAPVP